MGGPWGRAVPLFSALVLLCALALCCAAPALALEPAGDGWYWQSPQPQGQVLNEVTFGDALNVWAVGDAGTIMHSSDAGLTWQRQDAPTTEPLGSVVFTDALHGWAAGGRNWSSEETTDESSGVILATQDGGATWVLQKELADAAIADLAFVGALEGWAVGSRGLLLHTVDGGTTWTPRETGVSRTLRSVAFEDARRGYIGSGHGLLIRTTDGGTTWTRKRQADDGMWTSVSSLLVDPDGAVWAGLGDRDMSGSFRRLARSTDRGRTWHMVRGLGTDYGVLGLAADGRRIIAVGPLQEFVSSAQRNRVSRVLAIGDGGRSLRPHIVGASASLTSVASNGAGLLCAVGDRIVTSSDGGQTWLGRSTDVVAISDLDVVGTTEGWASGGGSFGRLLFDDPAEAGGAVYHTSDGVRWEELLYEDGLLYAVDFADASNGWTVGDGGVIKHTEDGGNTWSDQSVAGQDTLWYVAATSPDTAWAGGLDITGAGEFTTVLLRTGDGGDTWSRPAVPADFYSFAMEFRSADEGWVSGVAVDLQAQTITPTVLHTADGAATWTTTSLGALLPPNTYPLTIDFVDGQHGWIAGFSESGSDPIVLATTDGGASWQSVASPGSLEGDIIVTLEFVSALEGWASGEALYHTTDGGVTWTRQVPVGPGGLLAIAASDSTHVWAGGACLLSTVDAAGDAAPPATLSDVAGGWTRHDVDVHLTAADVGGSGVASTEFRVDDGAWTAGLVPPAFPAPADHSGDGMHAVRYRSTDAAGNVEPTQKVGVYIDTVRPVVRLGRSIVGRDRVLRMGLRIDDRSCPSVARIRLKVWDAQGDLRLTSWREGDELPTNRWFTFREPDWTYFRAGKYRVEVRVWDRAGAPPRRDAAGTLTVVRRRGSGGAAPAAAGEPLVIRRSAAGDGALPSWIDGTLKDLLQRLGRLP